MNFFKFWKTFMFYGFRLWEGEGEGGGDGDGDGGEGGGDKFTQGDMDSAITKAVDNAIGGLKDKNKELLGNVTTLTDKLKLFGDLQPEKVKIMMDKFEAEGDADLIKSGKLDELVEKRVAKERSIFEDQLALMAEKFTKSEEFGVTTSKKYNDHVVKEGVMRRAINAGVRKEAIDDIVLAAKNIFVAGDDGDPEARDSDGNLRKLGDKLFTADNWIESLKETKPHYWPDSKGAGAQGSTGEAGGKVSDLTAKLAAAAAAGDHKEYRRLREEASTAKK